MGITRRRARSHAAVAQHVGARGAGCCEGDEARRADDPRQGTMVVAAARHRFGVLALDRECPIGSRRAARQAAHLGGLWYCARQRMISGHRVLGLVVGRGGSKGLPRKNVLPLGGKPVVAWSVSAARASRYIDRVIVSSDDSEI